MAHLSRRSTRGIAWAAETDSPPDYGFFATLSFLADDLVIRDLVAPDFVVDLV